MPEKKQGMLRMIKNALRSKKNCYEDIVHQAETVISQYITIRKNEIIGTCYKKSRMLKFVLWGLGITISVCVYNLIF
ncbi:MAG: hypothetical protein E7394_08510 [Ruminococcaceae bacterium]|nr:hypothetical protein [Oscillospiraceae bacterium]